MLTTASSIKLCVPGNCSGHGLKFMMTRVVNKISSANCISKITDNGVSQLSVYHSSPDLSSGQYIPAETEVPQLHIKMLGLVGRNEEDWKREEVGKRPL